MPKDDKQETALTRLTKLISVGAQITVLKQVRQYLIEPGEQTIDELRVWVDKEVERLEGVKNGL